MGTLALDVNSDIYLSLGLKKQRKDAPGIPRVLSLLSSLLERAVEKNEMLLEAKQTKDVVTIFHGLRAPTLSIQQYVNRIFKYSRCSPSCFVIAQIYVDRYLQSTGANLTSRNVHRLLITSIMLAAKFIDDALDSIPKFPGEPNSEMHRSIRFFNNAYYARVGGVSTAELNRLEMKFLFSIDFRLQVTLETFGKYCRQLEKETAVQIERPFQACGIKESWSNKDESSYPPTVAQ